MKPWAADRQAQVSPRAEFYGPEQQQLRHLRRLGRESGEPPPASAALGQSLKDLEGGSRLPPGRKNLLRLRFSGSRRISASSPASPERQIHAPGFGDSLRGERAAR